MGDFSTDKNYLWYFCSPYIDISNIKGGEYSHNKWKPKGKGSDYHNTLHRKTKTEQHQHRDKPMSLALER